MAAALRCGFAILALTLLQGQAAFLETSAQSRAKSWLASHQDPDAAGMNDLKSQDPAAFSIVQALLAKQKLGLLDPTHPSASFTGGAAPRQRKSFQEEAEAAGITKDDSSATEAAMTEMAASTSVGSSSSLPYAGVGSSHHDPWNFHSSQDDDDKLVQGVLGQVANVQGQQPASSESSDSDSSGSSLSLTGVASEMMDKMNSYVSHRRSSAPVDVVAPVTPVEPVHSDAPMEVAPWHPPAPVEAVHSYAPEPVQSDAPVDVSPWHPPAEVSALSTRSVVSYPTAESSSQPFPGVGMTHDPWNYHAPTTDDDDKLVQGVLGQVAELKGQQAEGDSSSMSLSSMASSMTGSVASSGNLASTAAALSSAFDKRAPASSEMSWDSNSLTSDRIVPVHVAPIPKEAEAPESPAESSMENSYATLYGAQRQAPKPQNQALSQQNSYLAGIDFSSDLPKSAGTQQAAARPVAPPAQPLAANQENSYLKGIDLRSTGDDAEDFSTRALKKLAMSSFHRQASTFRTEMDQGAASAVQDPLNLGNKYAQALAEARGNKWRRSLQATSWGSAHVKTEYLQQNARMAANSYLADLSLN